jgi:predicted DNA-binding transcriptional regulator AlpA
MARPAPKATSQIVAAPAPLAVSVRTAAAMCGVGKTKFFALLAANQGPKTVVLGGRRLVRVESLNAWLAKLEEAA